MKIAIILNGISRKKKKFYAEILPPLKSAFDVTLFETQYAGHAQELSSEASKSHSVILAAGGDGTLNEVLNGILENESLSTLGVIPLGSGNDFATSCDVIAKGDYIKNLLLQNRPRLTDVGKITCLDGQGNVMQKYFINACSVGMGPATVSRMKDKPAWMGTNLRYLISILQTFFTHRPESIKLKSDLFDWGGKARVLAIANGKSFGNKIYIAPNACQDDGVFDLFIGANVSLLKFLLYLQSLKSKKKIVSDRIIYSKGSCFEVSSTQTAMVEAEGELVGYLPMSVALVKNKVSFLR